MDDEQAPVRRWRAREREVDGSRRLRLSIATVELPDGVRFEQYVLRVPRAAIVAVVDDRRRVLMLRRHRFVVDRVVWELPGGYVEAGEDAPAAAAREVEEETGWRPRSVERALTFQPMIGLADAPHDLYVGRDAIRVGDPEDTNEADEIAWLPLERAESLITGGEVLGAATIMAVLHLATRR